jgi:hypothetical protein
MDSLIQMWQIHIIILLQPILIYLHFMHLWFFSTNQLEYLILFVYLHHFLYFFLTYQKYFLLGIIIKIELLFI